MPFEQVRMLLAQVRSNYNSLLHENERLNKDLIKLRAEIDELKKLKTINKEDDGVSNATNN